MVLCWSQQAGLHSQHSPATSTSTSCTTPTTRPSRPAAGGADFDNFIPDFDPQEELAAFMNSIGDDFKDFNFERDQPRPVRGNQVGVLIRAVDEPSRRD